MLDFFQILTTICQILMVKSELVSRSFEEAFAVLSKMAVTGKPYLCCNVSDRQIRYRQQLARFTPFNHTM